MELAPLSLEAVGELAGDGDDVAALHEATAGNPFFVTEAIGAGLERTPPTVRDAVLARAARLSPSARSALEMMSVVPARTELAVLEHCLGQEGAGAVAECEQRGLAVVVTTATSAFATSSGAGPSRRAWPARAAASSTGRCSRRCWTSAPSPRAWPTTPRPQATRPPCSSTGSRRRAGR